MIDNLKIKKLSFKKSNVPSLTSKLKQLRKVTHGNTINRFKNIQGATITIKRRSA